MFPQNRDELEVYGAMLLGCLLAPVTLPMHAVATAYHWARNEHRPPGGWGFGPTQTEARAKAEARRQRDRSRDA